MRARVAIFGLGLLALLSPVSQAHASRTPLGAVTISGREFVQLPDWARAFGLDVRWLKRDETIQLTGSSGKIILGVDSSEVEIFGVQVKLLFPLVMRNGIPCLSLLDAQTTLQPILSPPASKGGAKIRTICIDPGHGGKDPGFQVSGHEEKKYTLLLAQEVKEQLTRAGFKASLTRTRDTFVELAERPDLARHRNADLFVSLHFNAFPNAPGSIRGAEVYCLTPAGAPSTNARGEGAGAGSFAGNQYNAKNLYLAYQVQKNLSLEAGVEDRAVHRARFAVLKDASMPAVLVEAGYMSHPVEGKKIFDAAYRRELARAIVDGIKAYKRVVER